jgi:polyisoprenyl-phosphate glycosyltransferase
MTQKIKDLKGPILIIGASGFVGSNIMRKVLAEREDVFGTSFSGSGWRLDDIPTSSIIHTNILFEDSIQDTLKKVRPKTIFDCSSFGAYSFESDFRLIHMTNYTSLINMLEIISTLDIHSYIHAGTSSEYGLNSSEPSENENLIPNSHYSISKAAASGVIQYYGKIKNVPILNLRIYSAYGPYEDSSRLIPHLCLEAGKKRLPLFANKNTPRDFIHIDDVVNAFIFAANNINKNCYGESINIGTGKETTLLELANLSKKIFSIPDTPEFSQSIAREWDTESWFGDISKAKMLINWEPSIELKEGLIKTEEWWRSLKDQSKIESFSKKDGVAKKQSITAIIACYKDEEAIPEMYERLVKVFFKEKIDYEIIFVNDCSPDNSQMVIESISAKDPRVIGVLHSRNFGSQSAFLSGIELANKEACVLLDGDLQDPPELISDFIKEWRNGSNIVYGRRVKREMPFFIEIFYKLFYFLFNSLSEIDIPRNAGDFSLIDQKAFHWILECGEKDFFLRGIRAFIGFKQTGVNYFRAERKYGSSTNNWTKNIGWAKKAIFSFSQLPLHLLTLFGTLSLVVTSILSIYMVFIRLYDPVNTPEGITFVGLMVLFFGSTSLFSIGILGEYIGKILEETKSRPRFIRDKIIIRGKPSSDLRGK